LNYQLFIALRYLKLRKRETFISILTLISIIGVAVGVTSLVVAQSLTTGTHKAIIEKIVSNSAHILIYDRTYSDGIMNYRKFQSEIEEIPEIEATTGVVFGWGLANSSSSRYTAAFVYGVDPDEFGKVTKLLDNAEIKLDLKSRDNWILLAKGLARKLRVKAGEPVKVITAGGTMTPIGFVPVPRSFIVAGTFETGMWQSGETWSFINRSKAQKMFRIEDRVNVIQASVKDLEMADEAAKKINERFQYQLTAYDWSEVNRGFYSALKLEKLILFLTLGLIVVVASLNIISTLVVLVVEKHKSIGILRAMGADKHGIMITFIMQGLIIGIIGTAIGLAGGIALSVLLDSFQLIRLDPAVYPIEYVRFKVEFFDCLWVVILALSISFLSTIYPARRASRMKPADSLRNE
jgi:lipoprotein-releasing system permease protein